MDLRESNREFGGEALFDGWQHGVGFQSFNVEEDGKPRGGGIAMDYTNQVKIDSAGHIQIFSNYFENLFIHLAYKTGKVGA